LMTTRPHVFMIQSSDNRALGAVLMELDSVSGVELEPSGLQVRANDYGAFTRALPKVARDKGIRVTAVLPSDESLENVFSYLVAS
jgi:ABC-2 type transport system ATP-binding protein